MPRDYFPDLLPERRQKETKYIISLSHVYLQHKKNKRKVLKGTVCNLQ